MGARAIAGARPDGSTLGILSVPGLLVASLMGETQAPDPATAFTVLGRIARSWHVWATGTSSPFSTIHAIVAASASRPLICAINEVGSAAFVSITATAALLGIDVEFVGGFSGSRNACLAAMRGDVDFVCFNFESISDLFKAGDLRPLLQVSVNRIANDRRAQQRARPWRSGWLCCRARTDAWPGQVTAVGAAADGLAMVMGGGRILVAPAGLPEAIGRCLADAVADVLSSPELTASTSRTLDTAPAEASPGRCAVGRTACATPAASRRGGAGEDARLAVLEPTLQAAWEGLGLVLSWPNILYPIAATLLTMTVAFLPGVSGVTLMALAIPFTLTWEPLPVVLTFGGLVGGATFMGSITAILFNVPGTGPSAATLMDGYPLAEQGHARTAIGCAAFSSALGSTFGVLVLIALVPLMTRAILAFGPPELLLLLVWALFDDRRHHARPGRARLYCHRPGSATGTGRPGFPDRRAAFHLRLAVPVGRDRNGADDARAVLDRRDDRSQRLGPGDDLESAAR